MSSKTLVVLFAALTACSDASTSSTGAASSAPTGSAAPAAKGPQPFDAKLIVGPKYKAGQDASVTLQIDAKDGYHVNPEYPIKFTLAAPEAGVEYPTPVVRDAKRTETQATLAVPFKVASPGQKKVGGEASLSVCTPEKCVMAKVPLEATVVVE
jgi:hypothetical protein